MLLRRVVGDSMYPALRAGEIIAAFKVRSVKPGDIIIFNHGLEMIKRVKSITDEGVYVLGDNSDHSTDSRMFGLVKNKDILGRVFKPGLLRRE